jgi:hypothetical protein
MSISPIIIPDELRNRLHSIAEKLHTNESAIISDALEEYFFRQTQKDKLDQETQEGLDDIAAGRLIEGDEIMAWLDTWGTPNEKMLSKP